jgi:enamine deaminase RidA (YjgF/YER057c/UK114 family)
MRQALQIVIAAVEALGGKRSDIIRTRMFLTDIRRWEEIGRVHSEVFGDVMPATTMVEVGALAHPSAVVEVEADAVVSTP